MGWACGFLKNFPLQRLHFIPLEAVQDFDLHLSAWLCLLFLLVREWDLAVSLSAYWTKIFPLILEGRAEGVGLTCLSFIFYRLHRMQFVLTSGLSVLLASNAVLFWSAAIRMHCETTGVWLKVVFLPNAWSSDCWRKIQLSDKGGLSVEEISAALSVCVCDRSQVHFAVCFR